MILLRQTSAYLIAHGLSAAMGFLSVILFTRLLTPAEYGIYIVALSLATILGTSLYNWVKLSTLRLQAEGSTDVRATTLAAFAVSTLVIPVLLGGAMLFAGVPLDRAIAAAALAIALGFFDISQEILKARQDTMTYMRAAIARALGSVTLSLVLVLAGFGGFGLVAGIVGGYLLVSMAMARPVWRGPMKPMDRSTLVAMVQLGIPMALAGGLYAIHAALDRLIIASTLGDHAAGIYGASADLVRQIIVFPALSVAAAIVPAAIRAFADEGREATDRHLVQSAELLLAIVMPAAVGLAIIAPYFANVVFGPEFRETAAVLIPILCLAWLLQGFSQQYVQVSFYIAKTPGLLAMQCLSVLIANLAMIVPLVNAFGLKGAAFSFLLAEAIGIVTGYVLSRRAYPLPAIWKPLLRVTLAVSAMAAPTWLGERWLGNHGALGLAATVLLGVCLYAAVTYALNIAGLRPAIGALRRRLMRTPPAQTSSQANP